MSSYSSFDLPGGTGGYTTVKVDRMITDSHSNDVLSLHGVCAFTFGFQLDGIGGFDGSNKRCPNAVELELLAAVA